MNCRNYHKRIGKPCPDCVKPVIIERWQQDWYVVRRYTCDCRCHTYQGAA